MSFNQGMAERGKEISRYQLLYFAIIESIYGFVSTIIWLTALLTGLILNSDKLSLQIIFVIASLLILLVLTERFKSLRPALKKA